MAAPSMLDWLPNAISAAFSGFSVIAAVLIYRSTKFDEDFKQIRLDLRKIPISLNALRNDMSEAGFNEIGLEIASQLRATFGDLNGQDLVANLLAESNHDFVLQAIFEATENSSARKRVAILQEQLLEAEYQIKGLFPAVSGLIRASTQLLRRAPQMCFDAQQYIDFFKEEANQSFLKQVVPEDAASRYAYAILGNFFSLAPTRILRAVGNTYGSASRTLNETARLLLNADDRDLRRLRSADYRVKLEDKFTVDENSASKELLYCIEKTLSLFPARSQNVLKECIKVIEEDNRSLEEYQKNKKDKAQIDSAE